eukprot:TRINITY_DN1900_c0_g2_i1.p2 TRINITY_DN1900_c0_g2~~TRINITY_DN1900_c0_g2_i1.p2  ORF type:complete len:332 (+),score=92.18 TRINITY_DN1900_c0_g2_i1:150-998(+)
MARRNFRCLTRAEAGALLGFGQPALALALPTGPAAAGAPCSAATLEHSGNTDTADTATAEDYELMEALDGLDELGEAWEDAFARRAQRADTELKWHKALKGPRTNKYVHAASQARRARQRVVAYLSQGGYSAAVRTQALPAPSTLEAQFERELQLAVQQSLRTAAAPATNPLDVVLPCGLTQRQVQELQQRDLSSIDYELLLVLDQQIQPKTLGADRIAAFPVGPVADAEVGQVCPICVDPFAAGSLKRTLPCGHIFCPACIEVWLRKNSTRCPLDGLSLGD